MTSNRRSAIVILGLALIIAVGFWTSRFIGSDDGAVSRGSRGSAGSTDATGAAEARRDAATKDRSRGAGSGVVIGVLREHGSERPLAGVEISLEVVDDTSIRPTATTAPDGSFRFEDLAAHDDWRATCLPQGELGGLERGGIRVVANEVTDLGVLHLAPAFIVEGDIVDWTGRPVAGAGVCVRQPGPNDSDSPGVIMLLAGVASRAEPVDRDRTDDRGRFRLSQLTPGSFEFEVSAEGFRTVRDVMSLERETVTQRVRFVLHGGASISGRVIRPGGEPVMGARLVAVQSNDLEQFLDRDSAQLRHDGH